MPQADVNQIGLEYVTRRSGEPIVFVHYGPGVDRFEGLAGFVARHASGLAA